MEGLHERFLVSVKSGNNNDREFEVVPSVGHFAILENDETVAELEFKDSWRQTSGKALPKGVLTDLIEKIQEHVG